MTTINHEKEQGAKKRSKTIIAFLIIFLLFLLAGLLLYFFLRQKETPPVERMPVTTAGKGGIPPKIPDTVQPPIDTPVSVPKSIKKIPVQRSVDTVIAVPLTDTVQSGDTVDVVDTVVYDPCADDTVAPWVYPDPSGGLHYGKQVVRFVATEPCSITWHYSGETDWHTYSIDDTIVITKTSVLRFRASDTCGNAMPVRSEKYEIKTMKETHCPPDMEYIKIGETRFCIDRYEWPNQKNKKPLSYQSIYNAMDSCYVKGKRLCTSDEWSLACSGVYSWKYPYGDVYEPNACYTRDTAAAPSGSKPECRGYFGIYDMSGNLAEWTDTRSKKNTSFYNVMGGFWESGPQAGCFEQRYSYFPQNKHNPVGFRCCKESE